MESKVIVFKNVNKNFESIKRKLLNLTDEELKYFVANFDLIKIYLLGMFAVTI